MSLSALYQDIVLAHNRAPRNFGSLPGFTHAADGSNPMCGDALRCELRMHEGRIAELGFSGESCAIATAAASMVGELVRGRTREESELLRERFAAMLGGSGPGDAQGLGELAAFVELRRHPARIKCATLPFATLVAALRGVATTSSDLSVGEGGAGVAVTRETSAKVQMRQSMGFRAAVPGDVEAIVALVESAYRGDASRAGWTTEADLLDGQRTDAEAVAALIADPHSRIMLAETGDTLVACAHLERQGNACYFGMFSVRPTAQGRGIGDVLIAECERVARDEFGCVTMRMTVFSVRPELIAWYARRGYADTGETKAFPYGDEKLGIPKRDDLVFMVLAKALQSGAAQ